MALKQSVPNNTRFEESANQSRTVLGNSKSFWLWTPESGYDLTHPPTPEVDLIPPRLALDCDLTPVAIDPSKTALVIVDMQNFSMSKAGDVEVAAVVEAENKLLKHGFPAARKANIQIIWLN